MENQHHKTIAILPLGATEQHGTHLPLGTDHIIASEFAIRLAATRSDEYELKILPTEKIGYSVEHLDFQGSQSLEFHEAISQWLDILHAQSKLGIRKVLLLNAHGGNSPLLTIVATEARMRWNMLVVVTHWTRFGLPDDLADEIDKSIDIHAGEIETSVMLAIAPELVDMTKAENFPSMQTDYIQTFKHLRAYGPHAFGWKMSDLNTKGVVGRAHLASAEKGKAILDHAFHGITELIHDISVFDVRKLK